MTALNEFVQPWTGLVLLILTLAVIGLVVMCLVSRRRLNAIQSKWQFLFDEVEGQTVEQLLLNHFDRMNESSDRLESAEDRLDRAESRIHTSKRYVGVVRYDAFEDVGGVQSFSLAIYDDDGNGAVLTSQVGREASRLFGKPLKNGEAEVGLTDEEAEAVQLAAGINRSQK
jgi:hypothetical protein